MLFPAQCAACQAPGPSPCRRCRAALRPAPDASAPRGVDSCVAVMEYSGAGRELVVRLKYHNARRSLRWIATAMASRAEGAQHDAVTWAPTTVGRRRARGFDQAELLARAVARHLGVPCRRLLRRSGGGAQTGLGRAQRSGGPAFVPCGRVPGRVLLVDDVVTTGATVAAAASALRAGGAHAVSVVAAARTPPPPGGRAERAGRRTISSWP